MNICETLFSMKGKTALITGAGSGMGRRFSSVLAEAGAKVICVARSKERLDDVVRDIRSRGGEAIAIAADVGSTAAVEELFDKAEQAYGLINVLVNSAAQNDFGTFPDISDERWEHIFNVNLSGTMRTGRSFSRRLIAAGQSGTIVNIVSIVGERVMFGQTTYGTMKAATIHLTRSMARDMFEHKIRANAIAPGYFQTEMVGNFFESDVGKAALQNHPMKRPGRVDELDGTILYLASDASSHVNGVVVPVDAGHIIQLH